MKKKYNNVILKTIATFSLVVLAGCTPRENPEKSVSEEEGQSLASYGNMCAAAIRDLPAFSCQTGTLIPITINGGQTPESYYPNMNCDRPSLLPLGEGSDGQCIPYSRVLDLSVGDNQVAALCRQKNIRTESSVYYDEIDIVAHNAKDGSTCWFQATAKDGELIDGTLVPSPMKLAKTKDYKKANAIWNTPTETAKEDCGGCHDNDPFMYSPFIGQVWEKVPTDPFGWYKHLGKDFENWKPVSLSTRNNPCVGCHRLGVQFTSGQGTEEATGQVAITNADEWAETYPGSHFMPVGNFHTEAQWNVIYAKAVKDILDCHEAYDTQNTKQLGVLGCLTEPIIGKP